MQIVGSLQLIESNERVEELSIGWLNDLNFSKSLICSGGPGREDLIW